ncbi:zinc finger protein 346-like [Senna tora]|uniref:Zinc finger protein 346-like n=1 Tax=Senna tora TaxID=362788 RepID=A0A834W6U1_9FABA|nr:zinc finger protein 346-like [Senna tora]
MAVEVGVAHGSDQLGNPGLYAFVHSDSAHAGPTTNSLDSNADAPNWIVKHVAPMRYEAAAETSLGTAAAATSFPSACNESSEYHLLPNVTPVVFPNQTKVNKTMQCEVCKVDCNNKDVFEKHILGKKHKSNLKLLNNPTNTVVPGTSHATLQTQLSGVQGQELFGAVGKELEFKKQKLLSGGAAVDSVRVCAICNIACNSQEVFNKHITGKKHAAQVGLMSDNGIGPYLAAFKRQGFGPWKKPPKKIKFTQPLWCEVCKINCNSRDVYITHLSGKKHLKNLEKLSNSKSVADGSIESVVTSNALQPGTNAVIGPQEKPDSSKHEEINSYKPDEAVMSEDIETKKLKLVQGGVAATSIKFCTLCNVVCNSQTVYDFHLSGQKHAAMAKKQAGSTTS